MGDEEFVPEEGAGYKFSSFQIPRHAPVADNICRPNNIWNGKIGEKMLSVL
jgi:hypothetical protein